MIQLRTDDEASSLVAYGTACLLSLIVSGYLYPLQFILGESGFFQQADAAQHVSGWLLYAADTWRYPLLRTNRVVPDGLLIYMTDSIPLVALALKPFSGRLPDGFRYLSASARAEEAVNLRRAKARKVS